MKAVFKILLFMFAGMSLHAQQIVLFNHYFYKPMVYNPAFTGIDKAPNIMLVNHTQWTGFKGGPQYNILTFDGTLINKNTGLGITIVSDKKGINSRTGATILYAYNIRFKDKIFLRLGLGAGAVNQSIDYSKALIENPNDPSLFSNTQSKTTFDANVGLAFICKGLEFGLAVPQIANNKINYVSSNDSRTFYTQSRHYLSSLKYNFLVSKTKDVSLAPQVLVRYLPNAPIQYDANLKLDLQKKFWIGATYKNDYAVGINLGVLLFKKLGIGYSYDYILGNLNKYGGLTHEIMLSFKFIKKEKTQEQIEDEQLKKLSGQDLNKLLIQRLLRKIETLLDKDNVTPEEIQEITDEISAFLDDTSTDPTQVTLNKYYKSLKNQAQGEINVLVKGKLALEGDPLIPDFSKVRITVTNVATKATVATATPTKDGKYFIILKPSEKYLIIVENDGYQKYVKQFSLAATVESYEFNQEVRLIK
ncbi:MAG: type IX secretion system membrane protein PorP/SprF [Bacteroidota bacterium]